MTPAQLLAKHIALDDEVTQHPERAFPSDWNGTHPFTTEFMPEEVRRRAAVADLGRYYYPDDHVELQDQIAHFHRHADRRELSRDEIIIGEGSSSFLAAFATWLAKTGEREVFYVPPLYYSMHYFLKLLRIRTRPIAGRQAFEHNFKMNLPARRAVLLLCDPIWYAGCRLGQSVVSQLADWQRATRSTVFVDGSFQYTQWDGSRDERTVSLDPELTFRVICPMKALGIPALRFSYLVHPRHLHKELLFHYENLVGASTHYSLAMAQQAMRVLNAGEGNRKLTRYLRDTYRAVLAEGLAESVLKPDCGYFVFVHPLQALQDRYDSRVIGMGGDYFELKRFPDHIRLNLFGIARLLHGQQ